MRNCVRENDANMQLDYNRNYCATWVQLQYGNMMN